MSDFGFADNDNDDGDGFGSFGDSPDDFSPPPQPSPTAKRSMRADIYAKSREQRMMEANEEYEYKQALERERQRQQEIEHGFGDEDLDGDDSNDENSPGPGFQIWGQRSNNFKAPPFVPRDKRKATTWNAGQLKKTESDKRVQAGNHGEFLIRETPRGDRHVVCVNDHGAVFEAHVKHVDGGYLFMSREFKDLPSIVEHLQRNPLYNKQGLPLYVDKPLKAL
eukprot:m.70704 g.70704  ORF g.70704 m.70704 type:complete len:222 (+) comp8663_c0_seq1:293-958(+)